MDERSALGFGPFFERQLRAWGVPAPIPARVAAEHRGAYEVWTGSAAGPARVSGRLRFELGEVELPAAGDWVGLDRQPEPDGIASIERVFDRRTCIVRGAAGERARGQVVAANVDRVFAVCGLDADYNLRRIERYLALVLASGAEPFVLLGKADLCEDAPARVREVEARCPAVPVLAVSAVLRAGIEAIRALVPPGVTAAFVGSSGAGKSTLINALLGEERFATASVRERDGRGCHTTTHRQLVQLPGGGLVLDTPGMRALQLVDEEGLGGAFEDIAAVAARCLYRDCRHASEPGCAVREAVERGEIEADRLENWRKLEREARAFERRHDARLRKKEARLWGQLGAEGRRIRKWKEGD